MSDASEGKCPFGFGDNDTASSTSNSRHTAASPALTRDQLPKLLADPVEPGVDSLPTGRCLCGKVSYRINKPVQKVFANHDAVSRRWTGGIALTIMIRATSMEFNGWGHIVTHSTSNRESHCFCRLCGSSLFVRHMQPEAMAGMLSLSAGSLDNMDSMVLAAETYFDSKPQFYEFVGTRKTLSGAEVEAMFTTPPVTAPMAGSV
ncbi:MAG: hypothetical protein V3U96_11015 [Paracoccaceae bacterium]